MHVSLRYKQDNLRILMFIAQPREPLLSLACHSLREDTLPI